MIDELGGLPAHPLVVHLPVVLVPLAALGVIAMAIRPAWLRTFGPVVAGMSGVGFVAAVLAASSGEALEDDFRATGQTISDTLNDHAELGEGARLFAALFFVLVLAWVLFARWRAKVGEERATAVTKRPRQLAAALAVLAVLSGGVATVSVYLTGHSGAKSVWEQVEP
jgi:hypothetical protein